MTLSIRPDNEPVTPVEVSRLWNVLTCIFVVAALIFAGWGAYRYVSNHRASEQSRPAASIGQKIA